MSDHNGQVLDDGALYALVSSGGPTNFDEFHGAVCSRLTRAYGLVVAVAHKRAPDFEAREVASETVVRALDSLHEQFNGNEVTFKFDPALAPFDAWLLKVMGGEKGNRGVIDTMRQSRRRYDARVALRGSSDELDAHSQQALAGTRWNGQRTATEPASEFRLERSEIRELRASLSHRERLVLRLTLSQGRRVSLQKLRGILRSSGFTLEEELAVMQRALACGVSNELIQQVHIARILGLSTRQVRNLLTSAYEKIRERYASLEQVLREQLKVL
jgi:RNA polymerase sigma factor (sigma-70 family)